MKSLCVFVHFDKNDKIADYVVEYLKGLKTVTEDIVFVSTSQLSEQELSKVSPYTIKAIVRENIGYDFMSWQVGLHSILDYTQYDEIIIANDSCYAPLFPFEEMFSKMRNLECDFWGHTENHEIARHIQSYFVVFNKNVIVSNVFKEFWNNIQVEKNKNDIIRKYEIGLSQALIQAGFTCKDYFSSGKKEHSLWNLRELIWLNLKSPSRLFGSLFKLKRIFNILRTGEGINPSIFLYNQSLEQRLPLFKIQLIRENLLGKSSLENYYSDIALKSSYDTNLIKSHLNENRQ